jgi:murein hydrolase activator
MKRPVSFRLLRKYLVWTLPLLLIVAGTFLSFSQNKKDDLKKQRDELNEKIALTRKLIKESESNQKVTSRQLSVLNEELAYREQLLNNINTQIKTIDGEITQKEETVQTLTKDLDQLKEEYGAMIYQAYKNRSSYDMMMFVFAAKDFHQAYKRFKMTQRYAEARRQQMGQIKNTQNAISENIHALQKDKEEKVGLATKSESEKQEIAGNKQQQQEKLNTLRKEEQKLRDQQKKHESDRKKLTAKIEEIIRKEIEEERKRAEAAAKKATASNATASTSTAPSTSGKSTTSPKTLELAPETKLANADFEKNRGALPWPVGAGVITSQFGRQSHPSLAGIEVNNNGLDFTTEKGGSALAVFAGTVTSLFSIPGAGYNIIITHGTYKTVYSGLESVDVKVGDKVSTKQRLGKVMFDGEESTLHFEVWKIGLEGGTAQNPGLWLRKR